MVLLGGPLLRAGLGAPRCLLMLGLLAWWRPVCALWGSGCYQAGCLLVVGPVRGSAGVRCS